MKLSRKAFLHLAGGAAALLSLPGFAQAQGYPAQPVHLVMGFPAGSSADIAGRLIGQRLSERLGQPFIIENRPGAGTNLGTEAVVRARPDGLSVLLLAQTNAYNATLYDNLSFNFIRDIEPVAGLMRVPGVMEVNPSVPARTVPEFIAYAKAHPGKINMASGGNGTVQHVAGELFKSMTGVDMLHVPYRINPLPDLISGQVQVIFAPLPSSLDLIRSGKLRALAVTTATRSSTLPDVPTVGEFVPGYEATIWFGLGVPKNTSADIVERLNTEVNAALADPTMRERLAALGGVPMPMSPAELKTLIAGETEKWGRVIRAAHIKPD